MAPSLRDHRPATRDQSDTPAALLIPSRTSSLHSRITQPIPSALPVAKPSAHRAPKTLTHAYMVCGVAREPSQWVRAPPPAQGKIQHLKGAAGQFWLPEILGSSPRLDHDNDVARALHAAMRVSCLPLYFSASVLYIRVPILACYLYMCTRKGSHVSGLDISYRSFVYVNASVLGIETLFFPALP
jgi:hypothetical protein